MRHRQTTAPSLIAVALVLAGCGGSSKQSTSTTSTAPAATSAAPAATRTAPASTSTAPATTSTAPATTSTTAPANSAGASASVTTGPVHATLTGRDHTPKVGKPWPYSVTVESASGQPLSGTAEVEFTFGGQVVGHDTPPSHPIKHGKWKGTLTYPAQSAGQPISLQVVVHTKAGNVTLVWPVMTQP
jgi:hypothetical protein